VTLAMLTDEQVIMLCAQHELLQRTMPKLRRLLLRMESRIDRLAHEPPPLSIDGNAYHRRRKARARRRR
jgi:hypothetical protein